MEKVVVVVEVMVLTTIKLTLMMRWIVTPFFNLKIMEKITKKK